MLRFLLGLSEAETAGLLGISVGTVKSQTHKGLRLLRDRLDDRVATAGPGSAAWAAAGQGTGFAAAGGSRPVPATARPSEASGPRVAGPSMSPGRLPSRPVSLGSLPRRPRRRAACRRDHVRNGSREDREMTDTDLEQRLRDLRQVIMPPSGRGRPGSTAAAWREFQALRSRSVTIRRRALAVGSSRGRRRLGYRGSRAQRHATRRPDQTADHEHQHPRIAADISEGGSRADPDERRRVRGRGRRARVGRPRGRRPRRHDHLPAGRDRLAHELDHVQDRRGQPAAVDRGGRRHGSG